MKGKCLMNSIMILNMCTMRKMIKASSDSIIGKHHHTINHIVVSWLVNGVVDEVEFELCYELICDMG
ncbi:hypothetical protein F383_30312 [Gossypium arboreum]|uniref:Uncharacterized protein n=1 Tax=Gossypium arboreum TaxID=29729 RepID=A0A0B0N1L2_GOSAR|nr:hypothetical protein F383_30312 [Gossypium arboreum]